jgi:hypothetical protein
MAQIRQIGPNKFITVDRSWKDNGKDAEYALMGRDKVQISSRQPAKPAICQHGNEFFYEDGSPLTDPSHVDYLPEPFKSTALKFIADHAAGKKEPVKTHASKEEAIVETEKPKRGRPKKASKKVIEIKDEDAYVKAGGIVV